MHDFPSKLKKKVFRKYLEKGETEASWLVRRAMGSTLSTLYNKETLEKEEIIKEFLGSFNWMHKCIGIIAIAKHISEEEAQYLKEIVADTNARLDLIWLADLYLSDSAYYDVSVALNSKLANPYGD